MATIKKSMAFRPKAKAGIKLKKAQNGTEEGKGPSDDYKERQFGKAPAKSQEGEGPSSDEKVRQGDRSAKDSAKTPPNKFTPVTPPASAPEKKQSFGEAFKAARAAKKGTFEWNGKKYTSDTKEEAAKKSAPASKPAASAPAKSTSRPNPNRPESESPPKRTNMLPEVTVIGKRPVKKAEETNPRTKTDAMQKVVDAGAKNTSKLTRLGKVLKKGGVVKKKMKTGGKVSPLKNKFAALAPPKNKITFADKIAGAKKVVKAVKKAKKK